ncbi:hypothetical protein AAY473_016740 [Plecturocebus cupreus]
MLSDPWPPAPDRISPLLKGLSFYSTWEKVLLPPGLIWSSCLPAAALTQALTRSSPLPCETESEAVESLSPSSILILHHPAIAAPDFPGQSYLPTLLSFSFF